MPNSPPPVDEEEDSAVPNIDLDDFRFRSPPFEGLTALVPKRLSADRALDVVLFEEPTLEEPNAKEPVVLGDIPLDASLLASLPKILPVELASEARSLAKRDFDPNMPPGGVASETSRFEDLAFEPNRFGFRVLDVSLLETTPPKVIAGVDEGWLDPKKGFCEGVWANHLSPEVAEFDPNTLGPGDSACF